MSGKPAGPPRLDGDGRAVLELAQVELAGRGAGLGAVGPAVDHHGARAADALAAVVVERDRLLAPRVQLLVQHVEQLEERHLGADVAHLVGLEAARGVRAGLPPHLEVQIHRRPSPAVTCSCAARAPRSRTSAVPCAGPAAWFSPCHSHAATYAKSSSSRSASPSSVWCSTRKCPPQLSSRWRASRTSSSPNSRKSATRPAFSSDWLNDSFSPSTRTSDQNSSRSAGISAERLVQALRAAGHAAVVPHDLAELAVEVVDRLRAVDREQPVHLVRDRRPRPRRNTGSSVETGSRAEQRREAVADRRREHEVAVGETLHRARSPRAGSRRGPRSSPRRARTGPGCCSSGCSQPRGRPSCSGWRGRCAWGPCTGPRR